MFEYRAKILHIVDGDTARVDVDLGFGIVYANQSVRFFGIDTPESRTKDITEKWYGKLAYDFVSDHLKVGETYKMKTTIDKGKFGRILGEFFVKGFKENLDPFGHKVQEEFSLNQRMVDLGYAVAYFGQSKDDIQEQHLNNRVILANRGLHPDQYMV